MKKKLNNSSNKRKANIFIVFLICSAGIWLISKLSEDYAQNTSFELSFHNSPDSLLLTSSSKEQIDTRLQASGFRFLSFNFGKRDVRIDLSNLRRSGNRYFIPREEYQKQVERQLPGNISLLAIDQDTLFLNFKKLYSKEVRVSPQINLDLSQNHLLEGQLVVEPSTIVLKGPRNEINKVDQVFTEVKNLSAVSESFDTSLKLQKDPQWSYTTFSEDQVRVQGKVVRFSEQLIEVPVRVVNLPEGLEIKTFPNVISILCKASIDRLKSLRPQDFELVADFNATSDANKPLEVRLLSKPEDVYDAQLSVDKVEYILIRR